MAKYYRRVKTGRGENLRAGLVAGGLAATVGALSFYLVRLILSREPLEPASPRAHLPEGAGEPNENEA
jgi:hypothetical protein